MANYFIEVRLIGSMKYSLRSLIYDVRRNCRLGTGSRPVPHISLVYAPTPINGRYGERRLISDFISVCSKYELVWFKFHGYGFFDRPANKSVAIVHIDMPQSIRELRWELVCRLGEYCNLHREFDLIRGNFHPHATLALNLSQKGLNRVTRYLATRRPPKNRYYLARATLLKNGKILREYDFALRRSFSRKEALDKRILDQTLTAIGDSRERDYLHRTLVANILAGLGIFSLFGAIISLFPEGMSGMEPSVTGGIMVLIGLVLIYLARRYY